MNTSGTIKIFGFGTLVLRSSAEHTCPNLRNFRPAFVKDSVRVFGKVNLRAAWRGDVDWDSMKAASCFLEELTGSEVMGSSFDIPIREWPSLRAREMDYDCRQIEVFDMAGESQGKALTFYGYENDKAFLKMMSEGDKFYLESRRNNYTGEIYRDGIFPGDDYLEKCLNAFKTAGEKAYNNLLDSSLLADRKTTLRTYIAGDCIAPNLRKTRMNGFMNFFKKKKSI